VLRGLSTLRFASVLIMTPAIMEDGTSSQASGFRSPADAGLAVRAVASRFIHTPATTVLSVMRSLINDQHRAAFNTITKRFLINLVGRILSRVSGRIQSKLKRSAFELIQPGLA
jgi:hypothetical protein